MPEKLKEHARRRVVIEGVHPEIDCGRHPIKRVVDEPVWVEADAFADGHDVLSVVLRHRHESESEWRETAMEPLVNDRWRGSFTPVELGRYRYGLAAWIDRFGSWRRDFAKRADAGQDLKVDALVGAQLVEAAAARAGASDRAELEAFAKVLRGRDPEAYVATSQDERLAALAARYPERTHETVYGKELAVTVDPPYAGFSAWYELFPRSLAPSSPDGHGTLKDVERHLPYVAALGFDVLYLPPIHPIGRAHRKGPNNNPASRAGDLGSPWAIGAQEGGHDAVHPALGTVEDLEHLVEAARDQGIEVALDIAFQCSPDHPWVREHPEWFRQRPDGTIQYAENPPKKYQDIYPIEFETEAWEPLWQALHDVIDGWVQRGVRVFRVDNPHTKAFPFWEWAIAEIKRDDPDVVFLAEAFTRPKVMYQLAKAGFSQSYTYFAWRTTKWDLEQYLTELTQTDVREFFRPNFWPNTPDILTAQLQYGGRQTFFARVVLAATLAANYGIYGPAFELGEHTAVREGSEEYLDSEKYQIRRWDLDDEDSLAEVITRLNRARREHPALRTMRSLRFHHVDNEQIIAYSKTSDDGADVVLCVVNLDAHHTQSGWLDVPADQLGLDPHQPFQVHDLIGGGRYQWHAGRNYVELDPHVLPAHVFAVQRRVRSETDFDYFQ